MQVLLSSDQLNNTVKALAAQLAKTYPELKDVIFVGIQQGGAVIGNDIVAEIEKLLPGKQ